MLAIVHSAPSGTTPTAQPIARLATLEILSPEPATYVKDSAKPVSTPATAQPVCRIGLLSKMDSASAELAMCFKEQVVSSRRA